MAKKLIFIILISLLFSNIANAQEIDSPTLVVSPHTFEFSVTRGEVLKNKIKILNQSEMAIPILARTTDFTAEDESGQILFDRDSQDPSFASRFWINIENPNFILDPGEVEEVRFQISVPANAEPGGHYATVLFEPQLPSFYSEEGEIRTIPVIGVLFLFSVEVEGLTRPEEPLTIIEFNIPENLHLKTLESFVTNITGLFSEAQAAEKRIFSIVETSHLPFTLRIKNNDIYYIKPEGKLLILANDSQVVGETEVPKTTILPGKIRRFPVEFEPNLPEKLERYLPASILNFISENLFIGKYQVSLVLTAGDDTIKKNIEFWAFPWKIILSTIFISCFSLFFLIKYRKRIRSAISILFLRRV